jgi:hypothetical protein
VPEKSLSLDQVFKFDIASLVRIGVQLTAMTSSGVVMYARGVIFPPRGGQGESGPPLTFQGTVLASYSDQTSRVAEQQAGAGTVILIDSGVQRFDRQQSDYLPLKISAPVAAAGAPYTAEMQIDLTTSEWTKVDLLPQWDFLTGTTGTLKEEQTIWAYSFFKYA